MKNSEESLRFYAQSEFESEAGLPARMVARAVALWRPADKKPADRVAHLLGSLSSGIPDLALACVSEANDQRVTRDIPYATAHERQILDIYADIGMIVGGNFLRVMKAVLPA